MAYSELKDPMRHITEAHMIGYTDKSSPIIDATGRIKHAISQMLMKWRYFSF